MSTSRVARRPSWTRKSSRVLAEAMERRVLFAAVAGPEADHVMVESLMPVRVSPDEVFYATPAVAPSDDAVPLAALTVPAHSSRPSAAAKIYLDFDGQAAMTWGSNSVPVTPAYTLDGDANNFSAAELTNIQKIWSWVAEKYSPFDIDVTTVRPANFANRVAIQVVIGGNGSWKSGAGGVAFLDAFTNSASNTCWVFSAQNPSDLQFIAEASAHEAGHTFGLYHQSEYQGNTKVQEYSDGDLTTTGNTINFNAAKAPTMGVSYYANRGVWSNGRSSEGNTQNDLSLLARTANGFGYRDDDHAGARDTASEVTYGLGGAVTAAGVIERMGDEDYFAFQTNAGTVSFTLSVPTIGAMLDGSLQLLDAAGTVLVTRATAALGESLLNFVAPATGTYFLVVKGAGAFGDVGSYTLSGTVNSVPLSPDAGGDYTLAEGGSVKLVSAASLGQITLYEWDLDYDGVTFDVDRTGASPTIGGAGFDGPAVRTIALRVTDAAAGTAIDTATLTITNVNPTATFANKSVAEGSTAATVALNIPADPSSADAAALLYSFDFDNDGLYTGPDDVLDSASPVAVIPAALIINGPATLPVRARIADKDGGSNEYTANINVTNAAPTATFAVDATVPQGSDATATFSDPVDGPTDLAEGLLYSFDFNGDGTYEIVDSTTSIAAIPAGVLGDTPGTRTIKGRVKDQDGAFTVYSATLTLTNVAPTATVATTAGAEGSNLVVTLTNPVDPAASDVAAGFKYSFDLNDDGVFETVDLAGNSFSYLTPDDGSYDVRARIKDRFGGFTDYVVTVVVANGVPTSSLTSSGSVTEGSSGVVTFGAVTDAGSDDVAAGFIYSYDFDNDGTFEITGSTSNTAVVPASFLSDGPFTRTVRARVIDKNGGFTQYTTNITVLNAAPTIVTPASANGSVVFKTAYALSLSSTDPGADHVTSWSINWGDGTSTQSAAALFDHDFPAPGDYTVTITATDEDGTYSTTRSVTVTSFVPGTNFVPNSFSPDGSTFRFTVVYDDDLGIAPGVLGDSDLTVVGPGGPVKSVRFLHATGTDGGRLVSAVYEATGPVGDWGWQDNGSYTVSVKAGEIGDLQGDFVPAGAVGTFSVDLVAPDLPDLVPVLSGVLNTRRGVQNTVKVNVFNRGTRTLASTKVTTSLYLSRDQVLDASDKLLASATKKIATIINEFSTFALSFKTPVVPAGGYHLLAHADAKDGVAERDERNNVAASRRFLLRPVAAASTSRPAITNLNSTTASFFSSKEIKPESVLAAM